MTKTTKSKKIEQLLVVTGVDPEKYFDKLNDYTGDKLDKLLIIAKLLK